MPEGLAAALKERGRPGGVPKPVAKRMRTGWHWFAALLRRGDALSTAHVADRLVEMGIVEEISEETMRQDRI